MKKIIMALAINGLLISCSKNKGGAALAKEVCDCTLKANAMSSTDPNRTKAQMDCSTKQDEAWAKIQMDSKEADAFNKVIVECSKEQIKAAFGK